NSNEGCKKDCNQACFKLTSYDWLEDINQSTDFNDVVYVRFKNTRKDFYANTNSLKLRQGDIIAVEASPGHDIGVVALEGEIVKQLLVKEDVDWKEGELKKVYRKAKPADIEKWQKAISLEHQTMLKSRKIAEDLGLDMKIGDVEYQGDKTKAIFYYIADDRVDFRQLIKVLAEEFKVRIEMRQIGARQEAGRIGGIGSCGRELCCSTWITNFNSVTTNAARYQEVSLNPQKLAGQCGKLKCCLNYELDAYLDAQEEFPSTSIELKTRNGVARHQKTDVFRGLMWYAYEEENKSVITCLTVEQVKKIIAKNKKGKFPDKITGYEESSMASVIEYQNSAGLESLTRFEDKSTSPDTKNRNKKRKQPKKKFHRNNGKSSNSNGKSSNVKKRR
ncbi:MAG: hypothetical protein MI922_06970, partial [Bacteroidales bacterium]|nr:hypothetical protein [Bacteroidales bacterium]